MKESGFLAEINVNLPEDVQCPAQVGDAPRGNEPPPLGLRLLPETSVRAGVVWVFPIVKFIRLWVAIFIYALPIIGHACKETKSYRQCDSSIQYSNSV